MATKNSDITPIASSSTSKYAHLGVPVKEWEDFYRAHHDDIPVLVGSPEHMRQIMAELKRKAEGSVPSITEGLIVRDEQMPTSDGSSIALRIYTPTARSTPSASIIYIHGGGWTLGDLDGEDLTCRSMCVQASVVVISIDYRLAPEFPFPRGLEDSWEAVKWVINNARKVNVDTSAIMIAGSSSGGNFAAVLAHRARDAGISLLGQILRIPSVCHLEHYPRDLNLCSMEELKDAPVLCKRSMELFYGNLQLSNPADPAMSPLLSPSFKNLPPAYVQIAGMDPLRDEGLAYVDKLREAGVPVKVDIYPGLPHAFGYFPSLTAAEKYGLDLTKAIEALVEGTNLLK